MTTIRVGPQDARRGRLDEIVESTWERVIVVDVRGIILHVNAAFEEGSGFRADEVVGRHVATVYAGAQDNQWGDILAVLFAGDPWTGEVVCARRDGARYPQEASVTPVINGGGEVAAYVVMTRDPGARRQLEMRARQGERMEALGQLASGIAHDFNNLLAAIQGFGEFVQQELPEGSLARQDMDEVMRAADSASDLTRQLLAFSRQQSSPQARLDLAAVVEATAGMLRRLVGDGVELVLSRASGVGHVWADARGIEQLLINLVVNARDAMPEGGTVRIAVEPAWIPADDGSPQEVVRLTVADTGTGMSAETLERIHEPFFTTKEPGRGTGLGLTTVCSVVRAAGGTMAVASELGEGTTFTIDFPMLPASGEEAGAVRPLAAIGGSETVLLVEDDAVLRSMYARHLRELGYRVTTAPTAEVGLVLTQSYAVHPDVVVTDVGMPGMHGPDFVRALRATRPGLPALMVSGLPDDGARGAHEWAELRKPFTVATLAAAVRAELDAFAAGRREGG